MSLYCFPADVSALVIVEGFDPTTADHAVIEPASRRIDALYRVEDYFPARLLASQQQALGEWVLHYDDVVWADGSDQDRYYARHTVPYSAPSQAQAVSGERYVWWSGDETFTSLDTEAAGVAKSQSNALVIPGSDDTTAYLWYVAPKGDLTHPQGSVRAEVTNFLGIDFVAQDDTSLNDTTYLAYRSFYRLDTADLAGETLMLSGFRGATSHDADVTDSVVGLELMVWGLPYRWRAVEATDEQLTLELGTPLLIEDNDDEGLNRFRRRGNQPLLGDRIIHWGTPQVIVRATALLAAAIAYRQEGTADSELAEERDTQANMVLGIDEDQTRATTKPWLGYAPARSALRLKL